jgi:hypothetical protein
MSASRILLAGVLGGIAMFAWTSIAHMATPLGMAGIREIPNEQAVLGSMQSTLGSARGFYFFPGMGVSPNAPTSERRAAMSNYQGILDKNPSGILIYKPAGEKAMTMGQLGGEFGFEVLEALLLATLVSMTTLKSFGARMRLALVVGIVAAISTNMSYWNWFGFPTTYTCAQIFVETMKYITAGVVIAWQMGSGSTKNLSAAA